jgi:hypothetical protein
MMGEKTSIQRGEHSLKYVELDFHKVSYPFSIKFHEAMKRGVL